MKRAAGVFSLLLTVTLLCSFPLYSQDTSKPGGQIEEVTDIEEITDIEEVKTSEPAAKPGASELIGRFHPAFVHFPVAWIVILVIFEIVALRTRDPYWSRASFVILFLTVLSFIPAMTTGFLLEDSVGGGPGFHDLLELHETLNIIAACIIAAAFLLQIFLIRDDKSIWKKAYLACVLASAGIVLYSAHVGGKMVFGENFFPF